MSGGSMELERNRELLSQAIVDVLMSWPEIQRRVFEQAHYQGRSVEEISGSLGLSATNVRMILENCDRRLRAALRDFSGEARSTEESSGPQRVAFCTNGCFR